MSYSTFRVRENPKRNRVQLVPLTPCHIMLPVTPALRLDVQDSPQTLALTLDPQVQNQPQKSNFKYIRALGVCMWAWTSRHGHALGYPHSTTACHQTRSGKTLRSNIRETSTHSGKVCNPRQTRGIRQSHSSHICPIIILGKKKTKKPKKRTFSRIFFWHQII